MASNHMRTWGAVVGLALAVFDGVWLPALVAAAVLSARVRAAGFATAALLVLGLWAWRRVLRSMDAVAQVGLLGLRFVRYALAIGLVWVVVNVLGG